MKNSYLTNQFVKYPQALERAEKVQLLVLDVDGVLTSGALMLSPDGQEQVKVFDSLDGHGIKLLVESGISCAIITGRDSPMVQARAKSLGIEYVYLGVKDKLVVFEALRQQLGLPLAACAAMGDDWPDLCVLTKVGLALAPALAHAEVLKVAHYVSSRPGGAGAVREVCDLILQAQNKYTALLKQALE